MQRRVNCAAVGMVFLLNQELKVNRQTPLDNQEAPSPRSLLVLNPALPTVRFSKFQVGAQFILL